MATKMNQDHIKWHACYCGCGGRETVYRGVYFWKGQFAGAGPHYLFTTHTGNMGFHVGEFEYKTLADVNRGVRKNYKHYPKMKPLPWKPCACGKAHLSVTFRHLRFYSRWNGFRRRVELLRGHSHKHVRGYYKKSELDSAVRTLARKPRPKKKPTGFVGVIPPGVVRSNHVGGGGVPSLP
jgi:hypothetical protein